MKNTFKTLIILLSFFIVSSCQKKQMAYFQKTEYENYSSETKWKESPKLEQIAPKSYNPVPIDSVYTKNTLEASSTEPKQTAVKPQKRLRKKLLQLSNQLAGIKKDTLSKSPDEIAKYQKKGKTAGILGLTSIGLVLIGFLGVTATASTSLLLLVPAFFIGIIGGIMGLSANKHLSEKSAMAGLGIGVGVLFALLFIILLVLASQFSLA